MGLGKQIKDRLLFNMVNAMEDYARQYAIDHPDVPNNATCTFSYWYYNVLDHIDKWVEPSGVKTLYGTRNIYEDTYVIDKPNSFDITLIHEWKRLLGIYVIYLDGRTETLLEKQKLWKNYHTVKELLQ